MLKVRNKINFSHTETPGFGGSEHVGPKCLPLYLCTISIHVNECVLYQVLDVLVCSFLKCSSLSFAELQEENFE